MKILRTHIFVRQMSFCYHCNHTELISSKPNWVILWQAMYFPKDYDKNKHTMKIVFPSSDETFELMKIYHISWGRKYLNLVTMSPLNWLKWWQAQLKEWNLIGGFWAVVWLTYIDLQLLCSLYHSILSLSYMTGWIISRFQPS